MSEAAVASSGAPGQANRRVIGLPSLSRRRFEASSG